MVSQLDESLSVWPWDFDKDCNTPMKVATVYRCVRLLSESVATLPLQLLRKTADGIYIPDTGNRMEFMLSTEPNEMTGAFDFWRQALVQEVCQGNAYIIPMWNDYSRALDRLVLCTPNSVSFDTASKVYRVHDSFWGINGEFRPWEIIHLRNLSADGITGMGVLEYARKSTDIALSGDKETLERFRKGGNVHGFFTTLGETIRGAGSFPDKVIKEISKTRELSFRSGKRMSFLPGGVQFKELMMSSSDMQFLENRKFTVREICRFFGVHPSFVFDDTSNNYKSAEMANVAFLSNTLNPILKQIENELDRKLLRYDRERKIEFDRQGLFACDLESRVKWQAQRIANGTDSINDIRKSENRPPAEGGDEILMTANLKSLGALLAENNNTANQVADETE